MPLQRRRITKADGRQLWYYAWDRPPPEPTFNTDVLAIESGGLELRWHPLLEEWIVVAPERQERIFLPPAEYCPLCPTRGASWPTEVPSAEFEIAVFENRFPSFERRASKASRTRPPFATERARGAAEVVLYSSQHDASLGGLPLRQAERLVEVWADRYAELSARREVAYVLIFENRGKEIGVTLTHPHGQIYAFPYVPPVAQRELAAAARYRRERKRCLHCDVLTAETREKERIVAANDSFVSFVPFYARWPYEVHIASREHRGSLLDLETDERRDLGSMMQTVVRTYDALWRRPMPFVMVMHQRPSDGKRHPGCHFHIEFTPPYRSRDRLKYPAGCETGAGTFIIDARAEETAVELRAAASRVGAA
jgi:UDPglucose--hexose-1-phosphate uridylyltransferase